MFDIIKEKLFDKTLEKIKDLKQIKELRDAIEKQLEIKKKAFESCSQEAEFDFQKLQDCLLSNLTEENTLIKFAAIKKAKHDKTKELILKKCFRDSNAKSRSAKENVRVITENCISIVDTFLQSRVPIENNVLGGQIVDNVNEHTSEIVSQGVNNIKEHINNLAQNTPPAQPETEFDTLKEGRKLSADYLEKLGTHGRFKGYDETNGKRITIKNKISYSDKDYALYELVFNAIPDNNISLHGKGGTGKTFQLLSLYHFIINPPNEKNDSIDEIKKCIPFYIELNNLNDYKTYETNNYILAELESNLKRVNSSVTNDQLIQILQDQGKNVILMLDGYNEITNDSLRNKIAIHIANILNDYKTKIILTSRVYHSGTFDAAGRGSIFKNTFKKAEVKPCSPDQVDEYFKQIKVNKTYTELNEPAKRLVETAQGLSMYGELLIADPESEFHNLGTLLFEYVKKIFFKNWENVKTQPFWKYLEEIAYIMVANGRFDISLNNLETLFNSEEFKNKYGTVTVDTITQNEDIEKIFAEDSHGHYEFTHQNFRDMYCALYLNKKLNTISEKHLINSNLVTNNDEILELCGNLLIDEDIIQISINKLKKIQEKINESKSTNWEVEKEASIFDYSFTLSILIKIFAFQNKNNIYNLNLENLDLSKVPLSRYKLYTPNEYDYDCIKLKGSTVSEYTFESNGLKRGASTICKYTKNNTEYIVAFCSDNLLIYNTETAEWKSKSYHFNDNTKKFGWINCACHIEEEQKIILGTDNGHITFFSYKDEPYINTDPDKYLQYDAIYKNIKTEKLRCIESIVRFKFENSKEIMLASNSAGEIFVLDDNRIIKSSNYFEIYAIRKQFYDNYELKDFSVCKITVNNKCLFYSWGNEIFQRELSKNIPFTQWTTIKQPCIFDIYCTEKYLFVNTGKEILVFSIDDKQNIASYSYSPPNDNITRHDQLNRFTKLSKFENSSEKVIIGTSAEDQDRNTIPSYIVLYVQPNFRTGNNYHILPQEINGIGQTMTTFSAVTFTKSNTSKAQTHTFIATTSNDRAVQILSADIEDLSATKLYGTYDGIHHIEAIKSTELLLSQYDGSVSHWLKNENEWHCMDVYPIHTDWVWKARYYTEGNDEYFFSCSYDGTVKRTNMITYETDTLIKDNDKIIDLALVSKEEKLYIYAVTEEKLIVYCLNDAKKDYIQFKDSDNLYTKYTGTAKYAIKSISHGIGEYSEKLLLAVNFYANGQEGLSNLSKIYELDISDSNKINDIFTINEQTLNNYIKIDDLTTHNDSLIITGQRKINDKKSEQIDVYKSEFETYNFSQIKSLSDFEERRIIYITFKEGNIFIGCLDGSVFILEKENITAQRTIPPTFLTHADLIAISSIDMEGVKWNNDQHKDRFKGYFKNL